MVLQRAKVDWGFASFIKSAHNEGLLYDIPILESPANATIHLGQKDFVNFAGINFLGLQQEPEVLSHFTEAIQKYGLVTGGSRLLQGVCAAHAQVEELLCRVTGKERAITFASGLLANLGFLHAMSTRFSKSDNCRIDNRDTVFVLDRDSHWSLRKGVERFPLNEQLFYFRHNDPAHLEEILTKLTGAKVIVVFESVYSTDGSVAPIGDLIDICERYGAISYVDDANGFFIYGPSHRPFAQEFAHLRRATFIMVSLSKAIGLEGGAIAGPSDAIRAFELLSGTSIFTAAIQPPTASTAAFIMQKLLDNPELMDRYLARVAWFRKRLEEIGCTINETPSYITSIFVGEDEKVEPVRRELLERGYLASFFHYPLVKFNHSLIRVILNSYHTEKQINEFLDVLTILKSKYNF